MKKLGVIRKQDSDLSTPEGFLDWVIALALNLRTASQTAINRESKALRQMLSANWPTLTEAQITTVLGDITGLIGKIRAQALSLQTPFLEFSAHDTSEAAKKDWSNRYGFTGIPVFSARDLAVEQWLASSTANFMRARDGTILADFSAKARDLVRVSLMEGLPQVTIAAKLKDLFGAVQSTHYYNLIASQFISTAMSYGALRSMEESEIELAEIVAILDFRTTDQCRFLDGKYIRVDTALDLMERLSQADSIDAVRNINPWIREGRDLEGKFLYVLGADGKKKRVADVVRSGVGTDEDKGEFKNGISPTEFPVLGIGPPPYHAFCRSMLEPVIITEG